MIRSYISAIFSKKIFAVSIFIFISIYVFSIWIWSADTIHTSFNGDPRSKLSDLIYGTAHKPYVKRALVPFITKFSYELIPEKNWESLENQLLAIPQIQKTISILGWEKEFLPEYLISLLIVLISLIILPFILKNLWDFFYQTPAYISNIIPVLVIIALPTLFWTGPHYIYDFPALLLFTWALLKFLQKKWIPFYIIFIAGCFNKETMIIITILFFIIHKKYSPSFLFTHLTFQVIIYSFINIILLNIFNANEGSSLIPHLAPNVIKLLNDYSISTVIHISGIIGLILYDFENKPLLLRQCITAAIPFAILIFLYGVITELRAAYEVFPIVFFLMIHTILFSLLKIPYSVKSFQ